jgi:hypothetical protein
MRYTNTLAANYVQLKITNLESVCERVCLQNALKR